MCQWMLLSKGCVSLSFDAHVSKSMDTYTKLLLLPFWDVPNCLQANLVNYRPLTWSDLDVISSRIVFHPGHHMGIGETPIFEDFVLLWNLSNFQMPTALSKTKIGIIKWLHTLWIWPEKYFLTRKARNFYLSFSKPKSSLA